ncbi:MAG: cyclic nucleotide-binding domain-containing protein [bacterium]|nr:cyclic nucleotide-binding domain-containing protein [bacterium]
MVPFYKMNSNMERYIQYIIRYRYSVLVLIAILTGLAGYALSGAELSTSLFKLFFGENPKYQRYLEYSKKFGTDNLAIIAYEEKDLLAVSNIKKLQKTVRALYAHPEVGRVHSLLDLLDIRVKDGMPTARKYVELAVEHPERIPTLLKKLCAEPLSSGLLVSKDGKHAVLIIEFSENEKRSDDKLMSIMTDIMDIMEKNGFQRSKLHQAGLVSMMVEMGKQTEYNVSRLFPLVCLLLLVTVLIMFHRMWPAVITLFVTAVGVIWTMGFAILLFKKISILMAMAPGIIMIIAFSDVVHICSTYLLELSKGERKEVAINKACSEVGSACVYTSVTTFCGFISMALVPVPAFRQLGVVLGVGVGLSLLLAMTLTPIIFTIMRTPKPWRVGAASKAQILLDSGLDFIAKVTPKRPILICTLFALVILLSLVGISRIKFETDIIDRMGEDNQLRVDARYFSKHFDGTNFIDIYIKANKKKGLVNLDTFNRITKFKKELLKFPEVDRALSVVDLYYALHRLFNPPGETAEKTPPRQNTALKVNPPGNTEGNIIPLTEKDISKYLFMFEMSGSDDLKHLINSDKTLMVMRLSLNKCGLFVTSGVGNRAKEISEKIFSQDLEVEVSGITYMLGECVDEIIDGQKKGLIFAFLTIFLVMTIALRSFRCGLWSMLPNIIPLLVLGGYVGWFWESVDTDMLIVVMIAIGIAVDDTIHFLFRYRFEYENVKDITRAIDKTLHFSGRAIVITSIIIIVGFAPFGFSDYFSIRILGTMLPVCFVIAILSDMLLIPSLIHLGIFRVHRKTPNGREKEELHPRIQLPENEPGDPQTASRTGYLLSKEGRNEEALPYLWNAFRGFIKQEKYSTAVMVADELFSIETYNLEILHQLSKLADEEGIEIPVLEIYKKYQKFHDLPLFYQLDDFRFMQLLKASSYHTFTRGEVIIKEGAKGDDIYFIAKGQVRVTRRSKEDKEMVLGFIETGDFLGEVAYMSDRKRSATITADTTCQLLSWDSEAITNLSANYPQVAKVIFSTFWERSMDTAICLCPIFARLPVNKRKEIIKHLKFKRYSSKETILSEGEVNNDALYIIKTGQAEVFSEKNGMRKPVAVLRPGDIFGECSLFTDKPVNSTIKARTGMEVLALHRTVLEAIIANSPAVSRELLDTGFERINDIWLSFSFFRSVQKLQGEQDPDFILPNFDRRKGKRKE